MSDYLDAEPLNAAERELLASVSLRTFLASVPRHCAFKPVVGPPAAPPRRATHYPSLRRRPRRRPAAAAGPGRG